MGRGGAGRGGPTAARSSSLPETGRVIRTDVPRAAARPAPIHKDGSSVLTRTVTQRGRSYLCRARPVAWRRVQVGLAPCSIIQADVGPDSRPRSLLLPFQHSRMPRLNSGYEPQRDLNPESCYSFTESTSVKRVLMRPCALRRLAGSSKCCGKYRECPWSSSGPGCPPDAGAGPTGWIGVVCG